MRPETLAGPPPLYHIIGHISPTSDRFWKRGFAPCAGLRPSAVEQKHSIGGRSVPRGDLAQISRVFGPSGRHVDRQNVADEIVGEMPEERRDREEFG